MLTGPSLAAALAEAMRLKGVKNADVAREFDVKPSSVSQWKKFGRIGKQHIDHMVQYFSDVVAQSHWGISAASNYSATNAANFNPVSFRPGHEIPLFNVEGSMGDGRFVDGPHDIVKKISVDVGQLRRLVSFTSPDKLSFITGLGDSMEPTYYDGDPLLVDTGVTEHKLDAIYALTLNGRLYIKTLQRRPDKKIVMISDNKKYEPYVIQPEDECIIQGRVLLAWNARRL